MFVHLDHYHEGRHQKNLDQSIFGFIYEFQMIPTVNMTYTRSQNNANQVVGKHRVQTYEVVIVMLLLCCCRLMLLSPPVHILFLFWTSGLSKDT